MNAEQMKRRAGEVLPLAEQLARYAASGLERTDLEAIVAILRAVAGGELVSGESLKAGEWYVMVSLTKPGALVIQGS